MSADRWVMVRNGDRDESLRDRYAPHILLRDLGAGYAYRYICLSQSGTCAVSFMEMRPAKASELLPMLPGEWAGRAVLRVEDCPAIPSREVKTLADAADYAFFWEHTPEGHDAWKSLRDALRYGTEVPECPPLEQPHTAPGDREAAPGTAMRCACGRVVRVSFEEAAQ